MKKYNKETVHKYLMGLDIEGFDIDELESNPEFMADVVCYDKNSYSLCSDEVKSSYVFVRKVLGKYKDDADFAYQVYSEYENLVKDLDIEDGDEEKSFELNIIMRNITKNYDPEVKEKFVFITDLLFAVEYAAYESIKYQSDEVGGDYSFTDLQFSGNDTIMSFMADKFAVEYLDSINAEELIHQTYSSREEYLKDGKYTIIVSMLSHYDTSLADYVSMHTNDLSELNKALKKLIDRWNTYEYRKDELKKQQEEYKNLKYKRIVDRVYRLLDDEDLGLVYGIHPINAAIYMAKKFGVEKEIKDEIFSFEMDFEVTHDLMDSGEITIEEGEEIIRGIIEENKEFEKSFDDEDSLYNELYGISDTNIRIDQIPVIKELERIFAEELGYTLKEVKKAKAKQKMKSDKKVVQFRKRLEDE